MASTTSHVDTEPIGARVVCGVDGTPEGLEAARQAARLVEPSGALTLVSSFNIGAAAETGYLASRTAAEMEKDARTAIEAATEAIDVEPLTRIIDGEPYAVLDAEAGRLDATLVVVGTHELGRGLGIMLGSVATATTHMPTRATLIARGPRSSASFPRAVVLADDGSASTERARRVAGAIAERFDTPFRRVACTGGRPDLDAARALPGALEIVEGDPHRELVDISGETDLIVVGSTGRRGLRALGSVSERLAHKAHCSVLIVPNPR